MFKRRFQILAFMLLFACCYFAKPDYKVCTDDVKIVVDDLFMIAESFEDHPWNPSSQSFKLLLMGVQKLLGECAHINIDLIRYQPCVDDVLPVLPVIKKLIADIQDNKESDIILDISRIGLILTSAITECLKHNPQFELVVN